jgi:hypothetical protein
MIRVLVGALLLIYSAPGHADDAAAVVDRLVAFAKDGCKVLRASSTEPPRPLPRDRKRAAQFGTIVKSKRRGTEREFQVASPRFPGWDIRYFIGMIEIRLPSDIRLTVSQFEARLGAAQEVEEDALVAGSAEPQPTAVPLDLTFPRLRDPQCRMRVETDGVRRDPKQQHVLLFGFQL